MTLTDDLLAHSESSPAGPARKRKARRYAGLLIVILVAAIALTVGTLLVLEGTRTTAEPPAPLPKATFSDASLPPLSPDDIVPPATGPASGQGPGDAGDPARVSGAAPDTRTPAAAWTFDGADKIFIQSLGISADVVPETAQRGELDIPTDVREVGRWTDGAALDSAEGTVLMAGHVNYAGQGEGALYNLFQIQPGAVIVTNDSQGRRWSWRVTGLQVVQKAALPTSIFSATGPRQLVVVTCGGPLMTVSDGNGGTYNTYRDNVIVTAEPTEQPLPGR